MASFKFIFSCTDNGGKHQRFEVIAPDKPKAIQLGLGKARKNAAGDICGDWKCEIDRDSMYDVNQMP